MRIWLQWIAVGSGLEQMDFSVIELYSWEKEAKVMEQLEAIIAAQEESGTSRSCSFPKGM